MRKSHISRKKKLTDIPDNWSKFQIRLTRNSTQVLKCLKPYCPSFFAFKSFKDIQNFVFPLHEEMSAIQYVILFF